MRTKSVMTIAGGQPTFFKMALNLALSFEKVHDSDDINFYIVTDLNYSLPRTLRKTYVIHVGQRKLPKGFSSKLFLDHYLQTDTCLFLDADCLVVRSLTPIFDAFQHHAVGVFGEVRRDGEWFGNTSEIISRLNIPYLPLFNGGIYYLTNTELARSVYRYARELESSYDEIGFVRLRGQPNEEVLVAASLARHGILPVPNAGEYYADFQWWPHLDSLKILRGECRLRNPSPPDLRHQTRYPASGAQPAVLHFLGHHVESPEYQRASLSLKLHAYGVLGAARVAALATSPCFLGRWARNQLRPFYRRLFGVRRVRKSKTRLILGEYP